MLKNAQNAGFLGLENEVKKPRRPCFANFAAKFYLCLIP